MFSRNSSLLVLLAFQSVFLRASAFLAPAAKSGSVELASTLSRYGTDYGYDTYAGRNYGASGSEAREWWQGPKSNSYGMTRYNDNNYYNGGYSNAYGMSNRHSNGFGYPGNAYSNYNSPSYYGNEYSRYNSPSYYQNGSSRYSNDGYGYNSPYKAEIGGNFNAYGRSGSNYGVSPYVNTNRYGYNSGYHHQNAYGSPYFYDNGYVEKAGQRPFQSLLSRGSNYGGGYYGPNQYQSYGNYNGYY